MKLLTNEEIRERYGEPGDLKNLVSLRLPYPMLLDYDKTTSVSTITCHRLVAPSLLNIFTDLLSHYGPAKLRELGIDEFSGCYNPRCKRGLETKFAAAIERNDLVEAFNCLSTHSWGIPVDLDGNRNLLRETSRTARFARLEYKPMIDIFYAHKYLSYGREKNFDYMHFEPSELLLK